MPIQGQHFEEQSPELSAPLTGHTADVQPISDGRRSHLRLTEAFQVLDKYPALTQSRTQVLELLEAEGKTKGEIITALENDIALVARVLRLANDRAPGTVDTVAVEQLGMQELKLAVEQITTFDLFHRDPIWEGLPERFRLHAISVQRAAKHLAHEANYPNVDRLLVTALLHDVGKLILTYAYPGYPRQVLVGSKTPEERLHAEQSELGVDHAIVGGVVARRWRLPNSLVTAVEQHHSERPTSLEAAYLRLADLLAHYWQGAKISSHDLAQAASNAGVSGKTLKTVIVDLPHGDMRVRQSEPCPLS